MFLIPAVLHGEVQSERLIGNSSKPPQQERVFTVKVLEVFKGLERIKNMSKDHNTSYVQLYTSITSCGIFLQLQQSYVVSGTLPCDCYHRDHLDSNNPRTNQNVEWQKCTPTLVSHTFVVGCSDRLISSQVTLQYQKSYSLLSELGMSRYGEEE